MFLIIALTLLEFTADLMVEFKSAFSCDGLGLGAQNILHGDTGGHDVEADLSSRRG